MKDAWETMLAFKLVWVRVLLYVLLPAVTAFLTQTETWSGDTWEHTHIFLKIRLLLSSAIPGCIALAAFIDQSLARARTHLEEKRGNTDFVAKHTGP
jgi:hypothetical protein